MHVININPKTSKIIDSKSHPAKFDIPAIKLYGRKIKSKKPEEILRLPPIRLPKKQCIIEMMIAKSKTCLLSFIRSI